MLTYISLFSSSGVGCYGFKTEKFECIATNELIERRLNVQKSNDKCKYPSGYILGDITDNSIQTKLFKEVSFWKEKEKIKDVDVILATPPCQGMSVANHKKTNDEIVRNSLIIESVKIVKQVKPRFFIFENVPSFMKTICTDIDNIDKSISETIYSNLGQDYSIYSNIINFKNYGACSSRSRTLVVAVRKDLCDYISPVELFPTYSKEKTLKETIGHLEPLNEWGKVSDNDIYHAFRTYPEHMRVWVDQLKEGESAFNNLDPNRIPHTIIDGKIVYNKNKNGDKYRRQYWDKVGPCVHTRNDQLASQNTIHPISDRVFSIRELMLMMKVPLEFKWVDIDVSILNNYSMTQKKAFLKKEEIKIRQSLGEAVPTCIFQNIALKVKEFSSKLILKTIQISKEISSHDLSDTNNLIKYICENRNICNTSLRRISELANSKRTNNAAFFTNKSIITEILKQLPNFDNNETLRILEPSVGIGNFLPLIIQKYIHIPRLVIDVVDIDVNILNVLKKLMSYEKVPKNITINYINDDFLLHRFNSKYDIVLGNPPFKKSHFSKDILLNYLKDAYNKETSNTFSFFLEKSLKLGKYVSLIGPKSFLSTPEFRKTREILEKIKVTSILDFGEKGFSGVLVETIGLNISLSEKPSRTLVKSLTHNFQVDQEQKYITDNKFPYWIIYRDISFDNICSKMDLNVFHVFRDRQITNTNTFKSHTKKTNSIRVIKSRNISDDGANIIDIKDYDTYVDRNKAKTVSVYKYLDAENIYISPNMTYKPRVARKPKGTLVNGSSAILIPKNNFILTHNQISYYSSSEYREFYKTARNYQTRSLNIDTNSVFFFGKLKEDI